MERLIHGIFCWIALTMFALGAGCYAFGLITTGGGAGSSGDTAGFVGNNGAVDTLAGQNWSNFALWQPFTATSTGTIGYIHFWIGGFTGQANVRIATSDGTLIKDGVLTSIDADYEWKTIALDSTTTITAGTTYRLGFGLATGDTWMQPGEVQSGSGTRYWDTSYAVGNDMSAVPAADSQDGSDDLAIYADNTGGDT